MRAEKSAFLVGKQTGEFSTKRILVRASEESVDGDAEQTEGGDKGAVKRKRIVRAGVGQDKIGERIRIKEMDKRAAIKRQAGIPVGGSKKLLERKEARAATGEEDVGRERRDVLKLLESELDASQPNGKTAVERAGGLRNDSVA